MTLETVSVEHGDGFEQCRQSPYRERCVYNSSRPGIQCLSCPDSGPVVDAEFEYADPRQAAFERVLKKLWRNEFVGQEHVEQYLRDQYRRNCRPTTMRTSCTALELFLGFFTKSGRGHIEQIVRDDVYGFVEHEQDRGMKPATVRTRLQVVKAFLRYLVDREVVDHRVLAAKISVKVPEALPRAMDPDDVKRLLSVIKDVRNRAMILIMLRTGMRIGEVLSLKVNEVNLKERKIEIFEAPKNRVGRVVYLSDDARTALKAWFRKRNTRREHVFYAQGRYTMSYAAARMMFYKYLQQAVLTHRGYSPHCLRHTFASELLNAGMRLECLQQLLGHSSVEMTRRYARLTDKTREEEYFKAMEIIERGDIDGHYRLDSQLQALSEEKELLIPYSEELHEHA